jgi:hypothetical protein
MTYYVLQHEEPPPFEYTRRQILDGIGVLVGVAVGMVTVATLLLGAWGW